MLFSSSALILMVPHTLVQLEGRFMCITKIIPFSLY